LKLIKQLKRETDTMKNENYERYSWIGLLLTLVLIGGLIVAWSREPARLAEAAEEFNQTSLKRGRQLYVENCTSCHGSRGEGGVGPALNNKTLLKKASDEILFASIEAGRPNTTMPAWGQDNGGQLTDENIEDIVTFIRAWEPNAPEVVTDVSEPSATRGAALFAGSCFTCHGEEGMDGTAPALNDPARLNALDDDWYRQTIANGRPAKGMPTWGTVLSSDQIEDLVALIGAWRNNEQVIPDTTVAELLDSALFSLSQNDPEDAIFYLGRARPIAFGPALEQFDPIIAMIEGGETDQALTTLNDLRTQWPIGDAESGEQVYVDACKGCHGSEGQGGVGLRLKPSEFVQTSTNAELLTLLFTGRTGTAMRSFSGQLSEKQLADVIAFLRTWQQ
jgi:mono/diheme cytochrome c family protein